MKRDCVLDVAQSKRLIARGVTNHPVVKSAFRGGNIGVCRGTTCTYIAAEFLGHPVEPFGYTTGVVIPKQPTRPVVPPETPLHDVIIRQGEVHRNGETVIEAARSMNPGDVIIKGANALNYRRNIAGCLVGHPEGGTAGGFWGLLYGRKLRLVIPVGLEKEISADILEVSARSMEENAGAALMPMTGIIVTEIEAIRILTGAEANQMAAGGVRGAEGAVRLLVEGTPEQMRALEALLEKIEDEPPF